MNTPRAARALAAAVAAAALMWGCTDAGLVQPDTDPPPPFDNKLEINGKFCTTDPADVVFPLKVLFIIDTSQSMNVSDPVSQTEADPLKQTGRARAIADVVSQYVNLKSKFATTYCNTGYADAKDPKNINCKKGSTTCPACNAAATKPGQKLMCVGPDCCKGTVASCKGVPACKATGVNGTCIPLCDPKKKGCMPGDKNCPDCPDGGACLNGICGHQKDPGVEFAIMRFGSAKQVLTMNIPAKMEGFTNDVKELVSSIPQVSNGGSVTDYEGAMSMAYKVISADISYMKRKNAAAVSRTKYVVILLSDGKPYPPVNDEDDWDSIPCYVQGDLLDVAVADPNNCKTDKNLATYRAAVQEYNIPGRILKRVKEIMSLKALHRLGDIKVHTSYLAGAEPSYVEDESKYLLKQMASVGNGTFRSFPNGESINFLNVGFSQLRRVFKLKNLVVSNIAARPLGAKIYSDSDGDGLNDSVEQKAGSNAVMVDTDGDGFSDTLEHFFRTSGWDSLDPSDADCPLMKDDNNDKLPDDTDGDGLLDCEERFIGTSRTLFDSDADGIPDGLEVKFGTNPVSVDVDDDLDFDGMPNGDEIKLHTDPRSDDAAFRSRTSYRYDIRKVGTGIEKVGLPCTKDADCPSGQSICTSGVCRCITDDHCSTLKACKTNADCLYRAEQCISGRCTGTWTCQAPAADVEGKENVCTAKKHITCYTYNVENITLVSPQQNPTDTKAGWNQIQLYMGEVPFDNPNDYGLFSVACVRAWYNDKDGAKLPPHGKVTVPRSAWKLPTSFVETYVAKNDPKTHAGEACGKDKAGTKLKCKAGDVCIDRTRNRCKVSVCVCPDGKVGLCR